MKAFLFEWYVIMIMPNQYRYTLVYADTFEQAKRKYTNYLIQRMLFAQLTLQLF